MSIPFNKISVEGDELNFIRKAIKSGHIKGDGHYTKKCSELISKTLNVKKTLMTTSCTHALEMCALLLNIRKGDEIIIPSYTFVSTVNSFVLRGAKPIFIDIRSDTLNIDETLIEERINGRTKAIIVVHYAGVSCNMDYIIDVSKKYNVPIIEDNAHGIFGKYKNKYLGTFGLFSTQSFHETKNFTCGEGGALIINSKEYINRAEVLREKGTNRSQFIRGEIDKYSWVDKGSSYLISDILSAFLFGQLQNKNQIFNKRRRIWEYYFENLKKWAESNNIRLPYVPNYCEQTYHIFYLIFPSKKTRNSFIKYLKTNKISASFHYTPLHSSDMGKLYHDENIRLDVSQTISDCLVRLPLFNDLNIKSIDFNIFYEFKI